MQQRILGLRSRAEPQDQDRGYKTKINRGWSDSGPVIRSECQATLLWRRPLTSGTRWRIRCAVLLNCCRWTSAFRTTSTDAKSSKIRPCFCVRSTWLYYRHSKMYAAPQLIFSSSHTHDRLKHTW